MTCCPATDAGWTCYEMPAPNMPCRVARRRCDVADSNSDASGKKQDTAADAGTGNVVGRPNVSAETATDRVRRLEERIMASRAELAAATARNERLSWGRRASRSAASNLRSFCG